MAYDTKLHTRLVSEMTKGLVRFRYQKENGDMRTAIGTINRNIILHFTAQKGWGNKRGVQAYFDMELLEWRCFSVDKLLEVYDDAPEDFMFIF